MTGAIFTALLPIMLLIALGAVLRSRGLPGAGFWPQAERLGYTVLLPSLLFHGMATARLGRLPVELLVLTLVLATCAVGLAVVLLRPACRVDGPAFTSIFQGSVRFNTYVGIPLASGLFGAEGVALAAICIAAVVPTVNALCVMVLTRHGSARTSPAGMLGRLATNPLLLASLGGALAQGAGLSLPAGIAATLKALGAAALPLGLLCVGAALDFRSARSWIAPVLSASAMKFVGMPMATLAVAAATGLHGPALAVALLFQTLPTASSAIVLARQLGGDAPLMAGIIAVQTVLAFAVLPVAMLLLPSLAPA